MENGFVMAETVQESVFNSKIKQGKVTSVSLKPNAPVDAIEREINQDMTAQKIRLAVEKAKEYHKTKTCERSEKLLAEGKFKS